MGINVGRSIVAVSLLLVGACASTGVSPSYQFAASNQNGLIVFGFSATGAQSVDFNIGRFNAEKGTVQLGTTGGVKSITHKDGETLRFYVLDLEPGDYVFKSADVTASGYPTTYVYVTCLADSTYRFEVEPGKLKYVGNLKYGADRAFFSRSLRFAGFSEEDVVNEALSAYPNISVSVEQAELIPATFPRGRSLFGMKEVCGGYYQDGKPQGEQSQ